MLAFAFGSRRIEAEEKSRSAIPPKKPTALWKNSVKRPITPVASRNGSDAKPGTLWSAAEQPDAPYNDSSRLPFDVSHPGKAFIGDRPGLGTVL
jgi:hypothetical protein